MGNRACAAAYAAVIEKMLDEPSTLAELTEASGFHYNTVRKFLIALRRRECSHVVRYDRDKQGGYRIKVHALGSGKDIDPPTVNRSRIHQEYKKRKAIRILTNLGREYASPNVRSGILVESSNS